MITPAELYKLSVFETARPLNLRMVIPTNLDTFTELCIRAGDNTLTPASEWLRALYHCCLYYTRPLRMYVTKRRRQQHLVLAWIALGQLFRRVNEAEAAVDISEWLASQPVSAFGLHVKRIDDWSLDECRVVTHALALYCTELPRATLFAPSWWRGFEQFHSRLVTLLLLLETDDDDQDDASLLQCEVASVHMDVHWLHALVTGWHENYPRCAQPINDERVALLRKWIGERARPRYMHLSRQLSSTAPDWLIDRRIELNLRPGDVATVYRVGTLSGSVVPMPALQHCRNEAIFMWWNKGERRRPVHEILTCMRDASDDIELNTCAERALYLFVVIHNFFVESPLRFPWMRAVVQSVSDILNESTAPVRIIHCCGGFLVALTAPRGGENILVPCDGDDACVPLLVWLLAMKKLYDSTFYFKGARYDLSVVIDEILSFT